MAAFPVSSTRPESPGKLVLRAAVAAYLGRYRGLTRQHSESDLQPRITRCAAVGGCDWSPVLDGRPLRWLIDDFVEPVRPQACMPPP
jgi:hypothetical protein